MKCFMFYLTILLLRNVSHPTLQLPTAGLVGHKKKGLEKISVADGKIIFPHNTMTFHYGETIKNEFTIVRMKYSINNWMRE